MSDQNDILVVGIVLGTKSSAMNYPFPSPPDHNGWGFWSEWTPCSATCGQGQINRMRICRGDELDCPGFPDQAVETKMCEIQKCSSGSELVKNVANDFRTKLNVDDRKLSFLLEKDWDVCVHESV